MQRIDINPERLQWCLDHYCIGLDALAKKAGIKPIALQRAYAGEKGLTLNQMDAVSGTLEMGQTFLTGTGKINMGRMLTPQFRTVRDALPQRSADMIRLIKRVERHRGYFMGVLEDIGMHEKLRVESLPRLGNIDDFEGNAAKVRRWLGIKGGESFDGLRQLTEDKNFMVFLSLGHKGPWQIPKDGDEAEIRGFALDYEQLPVIFVTKQAVKEAQAFTMMHELSHLLMHNKSMVDDEQSMSFFPEGGGRKEYEANMLASHVLLPESVVQKIDVIDFPQLHPAKFKGSLKPVCSECCVSVAAVLVRLVMAGRVPFEVYKRYEEWSKGVKKDFRGGGRKRHKEIVQLFGRSYVNVMLEAVALKAITTYKAIVYLDAKLRSFIELEKRQW